MGMTADELGERMPQREFMERMILERVDPTDEWWQAGTVAAAVYNAQRTKESEPIHPHQFIPGYTPPEKPGQTDDAMLGVFTTYAGM